jgi:hypothetical protein
MSYLLGVDKMSTKVGMKRMQCELVGMQSNTKNEKIEKLCHIVLPLQN